MSRQESCPRGLAASGKLLIRGSIAIALSVVFALTSSVSFAAWTATASKNATASAGTMGLSSLASDGTATIRSLDGHIYSAANVPATKQLTIRNTGTVPFSLVTIGISSAGTLSPSLINLKVWALSGTSCTPGPAFASATLAGSSLSLASLNVAIPAGATRVLCASTTFTGSVANAAGQSVQTELSVNGLQGTFWTVTDAATQSNRTFSQSIYQLGAPTAVGCTTTSWWGLYSVARVSWTAPVSGSLIVRYDVYFNSGATRVATTTATTIDISSVAADGNITIRAISQDGAVSVESAPVSVRNQGGYFGGASCG